MFEIWHADDAALDLAYISVVFEGSTGCVDCDGGGSSPAGSDNMAC